MKKFSCASLLLVFLAESAATAHPGHGANGGDHSPTHYLTESSHLVAGFGLLALVLIVGLSLRMIARFQKTRWQHEQAK